RALAALRRNVDAHLARVFEQLDLIRFDHVQLLEAHTRHSTERASAVTTRSPAPTDQTATSASPASSVAPAAIAAGEARLLATLAEARKWRAEAMRAGAPRISASAR